MPAGPEEDALGWVVGAMRMSSKYRLAGHQPAITILTDNSGGVMNGRRRRARYPPQFGRIEVVHACKGEDDGVQFLQLTRFVRSHHAAQSRLLDTFVNRSGFELPRPYRFPDLALQRCQSLCSFECDLELAQG